MSPKRYHINDVFFSPQGEGVRAGTMNVFIRFSACNLRCDVEPGPKSPGGFACDTEFTSGIPMTGEELLKRAHDLAPTCRWIIFTGGEPSLQLDTRLVELFHDQGYQLAIETNGTRNVDALGLDWVCLSPKVAEHALKQTTAHEVKYVRAYGQGIPKTQVEALHYVLSPAFDGDHVTQETLAWCLQLIREHPQWRLSLQLHKLIGVR